MRMPSDSELTLLFDGDGRQLQQFIEKHHEKLKRYQLMDDENEIRLFEASYLSDTHDFLILPKRQWEELDARYTVQNN
ncbi:hypothetical protein [Paenibacillus chitinolyticus]|uniref:hypothetical protein n=1 Tax=Paenibacillus chitinolyticus TaxID=79263 RepID=UPI00365B1F85